MRREKDCLPCVLDDLHGAIDLLGLEPGARREVLDSANRFLDETWPQDREPSFYITGVHRILKRITGIEMPFRELREACNRVGGEIAAGLEPEIAALPPDERFRMLCLWAVAGNHLDFRTVGTGYGFGAEEIRGMLEEKVAEGFAIDDVERIRGILEGAGEILYVPDNVGEIAFDRLLVLHLRERGSRVTVPYRGGPITSDAMLCDFEAVGLDTAADRVIRAGPDTLGVDFGEMTDEMRAAVDSADAILTKGQANFYVFHEHRDGIPGPICSLLTTKCDIVSNELGREGKINVATVLWPGASA
ncbi:MAG: ARMT1-like domain-containing protein [Planctomycetota bacterium]